jgi:hypothetical protein
MKGLIDLKDMHLKKLNFIDDRCKLKLKGPVLEREKRILNIVDD